MDLDDLKAEWARRDGMLAGAMMLNAGLMQEALTTQRSDRIRRAGAMSGLGLYVWIAMLVAVGLFIAAHFHEPKFALPAIALQAWMIVMGVVTLREQEALRAVDFGQAPVAIQQQLAALRIARARTVKWAFLTGQIVWWIPLMIILFQGLLRVDLYTASPFLPGFMAWNVVGGVLFIPAALLLGRWLAPRLSGTRISNMVLDAITGQDMAEARAILARIDRFQQGA